jgi:hypothetical protein
MNSCARASVAFHRDSRADMYGAIRLAAQRARVAKS